MQNSNMQFCSKLTLAKKYTFIRILTLAELHYETRDAPIRYPKLTQIAGSSSGDKGADLFNSVMLMRQQCVSRTEYLLGESDAALHIEKRFPVRNTIY